MILKSVTIDSFGGLSGVRLNLEQGLNVVLGPNESGKSTIFNAVCQCLFTSTKQTAKQFEKQMQRFIPVFGGDTIAVSVDFDCGGLCYTLARTWGQAPASSLTLPQGAAITNPASIKEKIEACLKVSEATSKSIMLAYQSSLSRTLDNLKKDNHTLASLGDILRRSIMEMDGVSVDVLKRRIEDEYKRFFSHWDREARYPENNRGIEHPYQTSLGEIISAFYTKEGIRVDLDAALVHEKELDAVNQKVREIISDLKEKEGYVATFKTAKEDALKRRQLASELKDVERDYGDLQKVNRDWPVQEEQLKRLEKAIPKLEQKAQDLKAEKQAVQAAEHRREKVEKYNRVKDKRDQLEQAQKALQAAPKITPPDVAAMRKVESELQNVQAMMQAGKLNLAFEPRQDMDVRVQKGLGEDVPMTASQDSPLAITAEGMVKVSHADWDMTVSSGDIDFKELAARFQAAEKKLSALLDQYRVTNVADAEKKSLAYRDLENQAETAQRAYEHELGDDDYDSLKKAAVDLAIETPQRGLEDVIAALIRIEGDLERSQKEIKERGQTLAEYKKDYQSPDKLLDRLVDVRGQKNQIEQTLAALTPLPKGEDDPDTFIAKYTRAEEQAKQLREEKSEYMHEKVKLESKAPDRSVEEFEKDLVEAQEHFQEVLRHGEALARIRETIYDLLEKTDTETYSTLEADVADLVSKITDNKYTAVEMDESLPTGFKVAGGGTLGFDLLSTGTQDVLAIALRLAFAREFLGEEESFIMLDDPLVDLDPTRQARTAEVIQSFSEDHQVILFTCHPSHAERLGGKLISL